MRMAIAMLAAVLVISISGCSSKQNQQIPEGAQCVSDSDCAIGGCSGELCGAKDEVNTVMTACVYQQSYQCLKLTSCGCVNGLCQWNRNSQYNKCLEENR